ncbi:MAG: hypothetical protein QM711_02905 [Micropruina sp.]|uniref:hypothetical protein n=1 Tax=Micropruina sp. TaxID=2737536 RepID=UPI0039E29C12
MSAFPLTHLRIGAVACAVTALTLGSPVAAFPQSEPGSSPAQVSVLQQGRAERARPTTSARPRPSSTPRPTTSPSAAQCANGAAPLSYAGLSYCPGYIFGVKRNLYGLNTRVVLRSVVVEAVTGSQVRVSGGPSCLPSEWCGQTIPSLTTTFATSAAKPRYADVINLFGTTTAGGLAPAGFVVIGHCDPAWGDC